MLTAAHELNRTWRGWAKKVRSLRRVSRTHSLIIRVTRPLTVEQELPG